ncbi:hypothetical protein ARMGADRAFT_1033984 [Armillaria gallica]|uniref:Uncharacterized protein n=1 Tax=Armillaria gallica TaxID=47427 RepID=A0A2H3DGR9_ARMGA|nr:hypothetical protein ARMGADRAFT_1033984 [Armillaria gallica]
MSSSSSSDIESTLSESVSELPGYQVNVRYWDILDKDFSLITVEPGDETDALIERVLSPLYCLLHIVETLQVQEMVLHVAPGLYRLCNNRSQLSSLILDRVSVPFIVTIVSEPFDDIDGWREDHRFSTMGLTLVPRIIDAIAGILKDNIPSHVTLSGDETLTKHLDSSYMSTLQLIFIQNFSVWEDIWDCWSKSVEDLSIGANSEEQDTVPTLQQFQQLKTLRFELNLVSDSLPWILENT